MNEFLVDEGNIYSVGNNDPNVYGTWMTKAQFLKGWKARRTTTLCDPEMWREGNVIIKKEWLKPGKKEEIGKNLKVLVTYIEHTKFILWTL